MTQEEKAKAYDKVREKIALRFGLNVVNEIFSQFEMSEDERIRKWIIGVLSTYEHDRDLRNTALTWLEKQSDNNNQNWKPSKEQITALEHFVRNIGESGYASPYDSNINLLKSLINDLYKFEKQCDPDDKIEPKFKIGDWVVDNIDTVYQIKEVKENRYVLQFHNSNTIITSKISTIDNDCHLWSIQDAKGGDVLVNGSNIFIFHFLNDTRLMGYCHINTDDERFYYDLGKNECFCLIDAVVTPATKEQRDKFMKAMADAGYTFDFEKKELKKIEQKPAWSEEDERNIQVIDSVLFYDKSLSEDTCMRLRNWLESLRPQNKWKPSDEQLDALHDAAVYVDKSMFPYPKGILMKLYKQLKKLREE